MYTEHSTYTCYICIGKYNQPHYAKLNPFSLSTVLTRAHKTGIEKEKDF